MDWNDRLVRRLRGAYSGELAAALAYRGHARTVVGEEKRAIRKILGEELHHRKVVGAMLVSLASAPDIRLERRLFAVGSILGRLCAFTGWLAPMWGAGRLESKNIIEYEDAAVFARHLGRLDLVEPLLQMAEVEWDHEYYFRAKVKSHRLAPLVPLWKQPPPRTSIRERYAERIAAGATAALAHAAE